MCLWGHSNPGSCQKFDAQQLPEKLSIDTLVNSAMEHNPDLDSGHCHLSLKNAMGIDHVNPKSWEGKVCVGDVNLEEQLTKGRKEAERRLCNYYGHIFNFEDEFPTTQHDPLRPKGIYVGVQVTNDDARSEEERETPLHPLSVPESVQPQSLNDEPSEISVQSVKSPVSVF